jgi:uncharacterized membrane-anchored protein
MNTKHIFIGIAVFWLVIFGGLIAFNEFTVRTGQEVLLKTRPIDPRDLFRGDYVILTYDISEINTKESLASSFDYNERVYVLLDIDRNGVGSYYGIQKNKPTGDGVVFIEGRVRSVIHRIIDDEPVINVEYGIESYFVPEGRGLEIERNLGEIYTKVSLDKNGRAIIRSLILDGKEVEF